MYSIILLPCLLSTALATSKNAEDLGIRQDVAAAITLPATPNLVGFDLDKALASVRAMATNFPLNPHEELSYIKKTPGIVRREDNSGCGACEPQPTIANYYNVKVDTASDFLADSTIARVASTAGTPKGYDQVYNNLIFASNGYLYMGYEILDRPNGYNPEFCAARCNSLSGCSAFNIYFERDPTIDACSDTCQNPPAFANLKCAYWGNPLIADSAKVEGQWRRQFHAVISGSNTYTNSTVLLDTAYKNVFIDNVAIEAPEDCKGTDTYMGSLSFTDTPFDTRLCAAACTAKTIYNRSQNSPRACNFWNTYILLKNGVAERQVCSMYTTSWDESYQINKGYGSGDDTYTISSSYVGTNTTFVPVCPSSPGFA